MTAGWEEPIRQAVDAIAQAWTVPGGVIAVTGRDGPIFEHAFGLADRERGIAATNDHLFEIGSISKIMTAAVVLQLVDRGVLSLDQTAFDVMGSTLPTALSGAGITVRRLLQHTAGLVSSIDSVPDPSAQLGAFAGGVADCTPGSMFHYSNVGFLVLGAIAARLTGTRFPSLVQRTILDPLGMTDSIPSITHGDFGRMARGYQPLQDDQPWTRGDDLVPAPWLEIDGADGNVAATARDLARFGRLLLDGGDSGTVLSARSFEAMTTQLAPTGEDVLAIGGLPEPHSSRYGLGINVEHTGQGRTVLTHGGGMVGFASFLLADLASGICVVVLTNANGDSPIAEAMARTASALVSGVLAGPHPFGLSPSWWIESDHPDDVSRPRDVDARALGEFVEVQPADESTEAPIRLTFEVSERKDGLCRIEVRSGGRSSPLRWTWYDGAIARLPQLGPFALHYTGAGWVAGPRVFRSVASASRGFDRVPGAQRDDPRAAYCGHFRTFSPWFTNFRVVLRHDDLVMIAAGGVEAPSDEVLLVETGVGEFRMGADERLPERLTFGPVINGVAQWVDRDGCRYSRSFTD